MTALWGYFRHRRRDVRFGVAIAAPYFVTVWLNCHHNNVIFD
jgi:hypothetical protein